jgi:hypothetical protein
VGTTVRFRFAVLDLTEGWIGGLRHGAILVVGLVFACNRGSPRVFHEPDAESPVPSAPASAVAGTAALAAPIDVVVLTGVYGDFVHVTADGASRLLTAAYSSGTGWDESTKRPRFTCTYYLTALLLPGVRENAAVAFNYDEPRKASVEVLGPTTIRVHVEGGPLYGSMALAPDVTQPGGVILERDSDDGGGLPVLPFRHVNEAKAYFYEQPDGPRRLAHLVAGDNVLTLEERPGWVRSRYQDVATNAQTTGWLRTQDLAPLQHR